MTGHVSHSFSAFSAGRIGAFEARDADWTSMRPSSVMRIFPWTAFALSSIILRGNPIS